MKVSKIVSVGDGEFDGWLQEWFGDHVAQISTIMTLKLRSAVLDVARFKLGMVPKDIADLAHRFQMPPQGLEDYKFVFGYEDSGNWVEGSLTYDENLQKYVAAYPDHWEIVQKCLGLGRSQSRHACLPANALILTKRSGLKPIVECDGAEVYTGQAGTKNKGFAPYGRAKLLNQGIRFVKRYTFENGRTLACTPDHLVLTEIGWMQIQEAFDSGIELTQAKVRRKHSMEDASRFAIDRGGSLLRWGGPGKKSRFKCSFGHEWENTFSVMYCYEYWCRECSHKSRFKPRKRYVKIERQAAKCLNTYRRYDEKKGFPCDLTVEDVVSAKRSKCVYCNRAATGLERLDNSKGHTKDNTIPACLRCNWMRGRYVSHDVMLHVGKLLSKVDP